MPSIGVDQSGNTAIGYSTSSTTIFPSIRYAGRLQADPPSNLAQGEATMFAGVSQFNGNRWGDYTRTEIDPADGMSFWHVNQYAQSGDWHTRVGKFNFVGGGGTPTPTPTGTPSATPTPTPGGCSWTAGADLPSVGTRFVGVFFPANGKFYAMGGRSSDTAGSDFTHPFEYDPVTNTWTTKSATYPDNQVNNMACGVLNDSGTDYIYCVGGSAGGCRRRLLVAFSATTLSPTPSAPLLLPGPALCGTTLPGGFTVSNNKLYHPGWVQHPRGQRNH